MNEQDLIREVRMALDESSERISHRAAERLAAARAQALSVRRRAQPANPGAPRALRLPSSAPAPARLENDLAPPRGWRRAYALVPVAVVVLGLFAADFWREQHEIAEVAEVDVSLLTDEVPISAYADRGFGVYMVNTRQ